MKVPSLGVQSELQMPTYATATSDPRHVCRLHHSSWQCWILNTLSEARDQTSNLMAPSWIHFRCATTGTPNFYPSFSAQMLIALSVSSSFLSQHHGTYFGSIHHWKLRCALLETLHVWFCMIISGFKCVCIVS